MEAGLTQYLSLSDRLSEMDHEIAILISPELLGRIDASRGHLSREEFISQCVGAFAPGSGDTAPYATREDFEEFQSKIRSLERSFIEFMVRHGLELGR